MTEQDFSLTELSMIFQQFWWLVRKQYHGNYIHFIAKYTYSHLLKHAAELSNSSLPSQQSGEKGKTGNYFCHKKLSKELMNTRIAGHQSVSFSVSP